jgi:enamine deaminase RidA (YjgF/YER057c/UK114 family)
MAGIVDDRIREQGIELPSPTTPGADYVPFVRTGDLVFLTGQLAQWNGERRFIGKVGREFGLEDGRQAARVCALNLVASCASRSTATSMGSRIAVEVEAIFAIAK